MMSKITFTIFLAVYLLLLSGCASTTGEQTALGIEATVCAPLDGIWTGEFDISGRGPYDFTAVHLGGKAFAFSQRAKAMCVGTVKLDDGNYISKYVLFALDGGPFDWATITGKLKEENKIASHFVTLNGGDTGALNISYNSIYDSPSSLTATQGDWIYTDRDELTTEFSIAEDGIISGNDSDSCEYLGYIETINPTYNAYQIKVEISECGPVNGEYEGVSFIENDQLTTQIANEKYGLFFAFNRKH